MFIGIEKGAILYELLNLKYPSDVTIYSYGTFEGVKDRLNRVFENITREFFLTPILGAKLLFEYICLTIGAILAFRATRSRLYAIIVIVTLAYFSAAVGPVGYPRYKIPLIAIYAPLVGIGFMAIWDLALSHYNSMSINFNDNQNT